MFTPLSYVVNEYTSVPLEGGGTCPSAHFTDDGHVNVPELLNFTVQEKADGVVPEGIVNDTVPPPVAVHMIADPLLRFKLNEPVV
jgi:hypothetical protein